MEDFKAGDLVAIASEPRIKYVFIEKKGDKALCLTSKNTEIEIYLSALIMYQLPRILPGS